MKGSCFCLACLFLLGLLGCADEPKPLQWHEEASYRWAEVTPSGGTPGFTALPASQTGITFANTLQEDQILANRHYLNGSGVAVGDVDGDGWTDVYFAHLDGPNALYRNLGGWHFEDVTEQAGVAAPGRFSTGAVFADVDGDGDLDLFVTAMGGPNALFLNDGAGHFKEATEAAGLALHKGSTTAALADIDGDGDLDLYVAAYKTRSVNDIYPPFERAFDRTVLRVAADSFRIAPGFEEHYVLSEHAGGLLRLERGEADHLYLNDGTGRFSPASFTDGTFLDSEGQPLREVPEDWALTARFQDFSGDGVPDLYVCNDFASPDHVWLGLGDGRFRAAPPLMLRKTSLSTMSIDFSDVDRDGALDFFLTDMLSRDYARRQTQVGITIPMPTGIGEVTNRPQVIQNTLFLNRGDTTFAEIARLSGVAASEWTWSGLFMDVDLDGYEDLLLTTGHLFDVQNADAQTQEMQKQSRMRSPEGFRRLLLDFPSLLLHNVAFRNQGDRMFALVEDGWGIGTEADAAQGMAFGDFDNDGDLDVVTNRLQEPAGVYRNEAGAGRIAIRLRGAAPNTQGIGARISVQSPGLPLQEKEAISGGQYLSGSEPLYSLAASPGEPLTIEVRWRSGRRSRIEQARPNRVYEIDEPTDKTSPATIATDTAATAAFEEVSARLGHSHHDEPFRDFEHQPLLPRRLSQAGPGLAWSDLDGDGDDDLLVGAGRGGRLSAYQNDGAGRLTPLPGASALEPSDGDQTGLVVLPQASGGALAFVGVSNYESGADSSRIDVYEVTGGQLRLSDSLPFGPASVGPLALADVDGDGDLDLFAGGHFLPGRYPEPASSRLYRNEQGRFHYDPALSVPFRAVGLVTGAAFGDLNDDASADLVLATEWGALRYFQNDGNGGFTDHTETAGLHTYTGWWNGVALSDFDNDGRLDLVATNWGWNTNHGPLAQADPPLRLYYGDFDANGVTDVIESHYEPALDGYVPELGLNTLSYAMPYVRSRMPTFQAFSTTTLDRIIGPKLDRASYLETVTLSSMVFLHGGAEQGMPVFEAVPLPQEAQFAPSFAVVVADYDADGHDDLFLSQNFFALPSETPRLDAGRGLWLRGHGNGRFEAVSGLASGLRIYGEQRGAAATDLDGDGHIDLAVTQNGTETKLYRNRQAPVGLRVRLEGPPQNAAGVGSILQPIYADGTRGPARLVTAGSGYWSQSSPMLVLGRRAAIHELEVRWPDGATSTVPVPAAATEVIIPLHSR